MLLPLPFIWGCWVAREESLHLIHILSWTKVSDPFHMLMTKSVSIIHRFIEDMEMKSTPIL